MTDLGARDLLVGVSLTVRPTPIVRAASVSRALGVDVFVKREDLTHDACGGNKVRKLARILPDARAQGATDLVTAGAEGSNHVLATVVHGRSEGFDVHALLVPQAGDVPRPVRGPCVARGAKVIDTDRARLTQTFERVVAELRASGRVPYVVPIGGSTALGTEGYADAIDELVLQLGLDARALRAVSAAEGLERTDSPGFAGVRCELDRAPDVMVAALGTGGTVAGLALGVQRRGLTSRVLAVRVVEPELTSEASVRRLCMGAPLEIDGGQVGGGYSLPTDAATEAIAMFAEDGVPLEPVYTGKAAAGLVADARAKKRGTYLFWFTRPNV